MNLENSLKDESSFILMNIICMKVMKSLVVDHISYLCIYSWEIILLTFHFEIILDLQKRRITEFSFALHPASPNDKNLHNHSIIINTRKWTLI